MPSESQEEVWVGAVLCGGVCTDRDRRRQTQTPNRHPPPPHTHIHPHARKLAGAFAASFLSWSPEGDALAISGSKVRARAGDVAALEKVDLRSTMNTTYTHTHTHNACMHPSAMCVRAL